MKLCIFLASDMFIDFEMHLVCMCLKRLCYIAVFCTNRETYMDGYINKIHTNPFSLSLRNLGTSSALAPQRKKFSSPISSLISTLAPSSVPIMRQPFRANFMLLVPLASMPAVLICWESSLPGISISATDTL